MAGYRSKPRRLAPVCYRHIGGLLGEGLFKSFVKRGWLARDGEAITPKGLAAFKAMGVEVERLSASKRKPVNACVERHAGKFHPHVGSHMSQLLAETFVARGWLACEDKDFRITPAGRIGLRKLGVDVTRLTAD